MIIHLKKDCQPDKIVTLAQQTESVYFKDQNDTVVLVTPSKTKDLPEFIAPFTENYWVLDNDIQLASKVYLNEVRSVEINGSKLGGDHRNTAIISGPCSVESWEQITESAAFMSELGIKTFRAGCFKPRTSPYSFQGLGIEGLKMLDKIRTIYGFNIITEVRDASHVDDVIAFADIIQIGAKAMYDHGILRKCGAALKPVLLKRGFGTTLQEFVQSAEFILSGGNEQVMLCERGIRTFETKTRFTLDLCGVAYLKEYTNLPIILDPSHAMGYRYGVADLSRACMAMGIDGLLIESHPNPAVAKSDASQQLNHPEFKALYDSLKPIANAVGRNMI